MPLNIKYISTNGSDFYSASGGGEGIGGGLIDIEQSWQIISIPLRFGYYNPLIHEHVHDTAVLATVYNYVVLQIEDKFGVPANTMIEVFNTLIGGQGNYWNFVPGVTNPLSPHNFNLCYPDITSINYEVTGFFVKSIHSTNFTIQWGEI